MTRDPARSSDHETLSALFDDALDAEAARFARRRLLHDADWQARIVRWQLAGDVLRGERSLPLPESFAARVAAAIAGEAGSTVASTTAARPRPPLRRWPWLGGTALAASVALVALLVWPDAPPVTTPATGTAGTVLSGAAPMTSTTVSAAAQLPATQSPATAMQTAGNDAQVAVIAPASRRAAVAMRRERIAPSLPAASTMLASAVPASAASAHTVATTGAADPFGLQGQAIPSRPWPRDRFGLGQGSAMTAAYEFAQAVPASDDPFRPAGRHAAPSTGHGTQSAPAEAESQRRPVIHDAPP